MLTAIDHVILAVADAVAAAAEIERTLGLRSGGGGRHDAHGTFNRLFWLGDSYIELMSVFDRELAAQSWWGAHMSAVLSRAPAGYAGMALASDDLPADIARLRSLGAPISDPIDGQRVRADSEVVRWSIGRLPAPGAEVGLTFVIEHDTAAAEWRPAERAARAAEEHPLGGPARLIRVELPVADVARASMRLLRDLGIQFRPSLSGAGARDASIGTQTLRLRPAQPGSSVTIVIRAGRATEPRTVAMLGCDWVLIPNTA